MRCSGSWRARSHGLVGGGVVDQDHLVDLVLGDLGEGPLQGRGGLPGRHHDDDLRLAPCSDSAKARLDVDGSRRAAGRSPTRAQTAATGSRSTPAAIEARRLAAPQTARCAPAAGAAPGRGRGRRAARPTRPSSQPITICPPRISETRSTRNPHRSEPGARGCACERWTRWRGRSRCSQRSPKARAWRLSVLGTATTHDAARLSSSRAASRIASPGSGQVLERVPEDDRGPLAPRPRRAARRARRGAWSRARGPSPRGRGAAGRRSASRPRRRRRAPGPAGRSRRCGRARAPGCG